MNEDISIERSRKILRGILDKCRRYARAVDEGKDMLAEAIRCDIRRYNAALGYISTAPRRN
jgi:hypothetical protein